MTDPILMAGVKNAHEALMECPDALDIALIKDDKGHKYVYVNSSREAKKIRSKVTLIIRDMWGAGAFNYTQIAQTLRVDDLAIKAILEPEWREEVGLD